MGNGYIGLFGLKQQNALKTILNKVLEGQMSNTITYIWEDAYSRTAYFIRHTAYGIIPYIRYCRVYTAH